MPRVCMTLLTVVLITALSAPATGQARVESPFSAMMTLTEANSARVSSFDRTGNNSDLVPVPAGKSIELASITGAGVIRHLYFSVAGGRHYLRDLVLRAYWDGEETPSVEVPFGDFFGLGQERARFFTSLMITVNPGDMGVLGTYGFNSYFPMPFASGARLTLTNDGPDPVPAVWYHVEYDRVASLSADLGRFHASWNRANPTKAIGKVPNKTMHDATHSSGEGNYVILDTQGRGNVAGFFLNIDNTMGGWYGEGDDMIFVDGESWPPAYHGTGTEEIFGSGACPTVEFAGPYTGFHLIGNIDYTGKVSMYRFYVNDPIRFQHSIRMTIEHGHANNIANDYSSTVFWYQSGAGAAYRPLPPAAERRPREGADPHDKAWATLMAVKEKAFPVWFRSITRGEAIPYALAQLMKSDISQSYLRRDYARVRTQATSLSAQLDAYSKSVRDRSRDDTVRPRRSSGSR